MRPPLNNGNAVGPPLGREAQAANSQISRKRASDRNHANAPKALQIERRLGTVR